MSGVRIVFPKPKLAKLLQAAGGKPVAEALQEAQANLAVLRPQCIEELLSLVEQIETAFGQAPEGGGDPTTAELYSLASDGVGLGAVAGLPAADEALISLCRLVDHLQMAKRWNAEALAVHVRTLKYLVHTSDAPKEATDALLAGLQRVNAHYKPAGE